MNFFDELIGKVIIFKTIGNKDDKNEIGTLLANTPDYLLVRTGPANNIEKAFFKNNIISVYEKTW